LPRWLPQKLYKPPGMAAIARTFATQLISMAPGSSREPSVSWPQVQGCGRSRMLRQCWPEGFPVPMRPWGALVRDMRTRLRWERVSTRDHVLSREQPCSLGWLRAAMRSRRARSGRAVCDRGGPGLAGGGVRGRRADSDAPHPRRGPRPANRPGRMSAGDVRGRRGTEVPEGIPGGGVGSGQGRS
jgi:hypothetical protein